MDSIEQTIQAKGLTAPRVTPNDIEASIAAEYSFTVDKATTGAPQLPGLALISIVVLILNNGHRIVGVNEGPVSAENFDPDLGRQLARKKATDQIWPLLGYQLRTELARPVLTEADALADLEGRPRPDHPTV